MMSHVLSPGLPHTLAQYAAVTIELEAAPRTREHVLARFQLDEASLAKLASAFEGLMAREPAAHDAWQQARDIYLAWRRQQHR